MLTSDLDDNGDVDWPILFWDVENKFKIKMKLEKINTIFVDMHVIHMEFDYVDVTNRRCVVGDS